MDALAWLYFVKNFYYVWLNKSALLFVGYNEQQNKNVSHQVWDIEN